jgi:hypothetical protein
VKPHVLVTVVGDDGEDRVFTTPRPGGTMATRTGTPHLYEHSPILAEERPVEDVVVEALGVGVLINQGDTHATRRGLLPYFVDGVVGLPTPTLASSEPTSLALHSTTVEAGLPSARDLNANGGGDTFFSPTRGVLSDL